MQTFTGWNYLLIDAANQAGFDKLLFEERIKWTEEMIAKNLLEGFADQADNKPLYIKAVMAIRKAQSGLPTGHLVGFDAVCSGVQVMSAITGCVAGATATGLVDPTVRADAYSKLTEVMNELLGTSTGVSRKDAKQAMMTSFYGSKKEPIAIFGEDTPELSAFYQAENIIAPGAWELLQILLASWKPYALVHQWKLPDGFDAKVKVMTKVDKHNSRSKIEVDELDHATFTYEFYENVGTERGLSNVANVVHSLDAYVLRCVQRRCNYDVDVVNQANQLIQKELHARSVGTSEVTGYSGKKLAYYIEQYDRSDMADVVILPYLTAANISMLDSVLLLELGNIVGQMLEYKPFPVVTVHDEFRVHCNNVNYLRQCYINVFADLADSNVLSDLLTQLFDKPVQYKKLSSNLGDLIRGSNYGLS